MHVPAEQKAPIGPRDTAKNLKQTTAAPPDFSLIGKADEEKRVLRDSAKQSASGPRDGKKAQPTTPAPRSIPHQRQGDRGADDGADNAKLPVYCRLPRPGQSRHRDELAATATNGHRSRLSDRHNVVGKHSRLGSRPDPTMARGQADRAQSRQRAKGKRDATSGGPGRRFKENVTNENPRRSGERAGFLFDSVRRVAPPKRMGKLREARSNNAPCPLGSSCLDL
jgi:hypothetical protein